MYSVNGIERITLIYCNCQIAHWLQCGERFDILNEQKFAWQEYSLSQSMATELKEREIEENRESSNHGN